MELSLKIAIMNLSHLPLLNLKDLFEYLNSLDQINLLKAIDHNAEYKQYLFNAVILMDVSSIDLLNDSLSKLFFAKFTL